MTEEDFKYDPDKIKRGLATIVVIIPWLIILILGYKLQTIMTNYNECAVQCNDLITHTLNNCHTVNRNNPPTFTWPTIQNGQTNGT